MTAADEHAERFVLLRPLLFTIAYEITGSTTEADDVLQDSYLRWAQVDLAGVHDTKSYLARLVTRQALNALRADARRREDYVGPWLPEPLLLDEQDPSADVVLAESVSMAMLVLLETLSPDERAVFVLREVFGFDYDDIASAVDKSPAAVRQVAHRAREHVQARRKRFTPADPAQNARIAAEFMAAAAGGDVQTVMSMLSPDVVWTADSGGKASAARRPVIGADKVARAVVGLISRGMQLADVRAEMAMCNGAPAMVLYAGGRLEGIFTFEIVDGKITNFYAMRNPDKLAAAAGGDVQAVMAMLAPDVVWTADSDGKVSAARRPVVGADKVARAIVGLISRGMQIPDVRAEMVVCNAAPAVLLYAADRLEGVFTIEIVDGKISNFYAMRNPDKLATVTTARKISRG